MENRNIHLFDLVSTHTGRRSPVCFWQGYGVVCASEVTTNGNIPLFAKWIISHMEAKNFTVIPCKLVPDLTSETSFMRQLHNFWNLKYGN